MMPDNPRPEETTLRRHCRLYLKTFRACREGNIAAYYCHRRADKVADAEFHLTPDERKKRNEWLDSKVEFKGWNREPPEDKGRSLFEGDEVMHVD